jgi:hypothetical protein
MPHSTPLRRLILFIALVTLSVGLLSYLITSLSLNRDAAQIIPVSPKPSIEPITTPIAPFAGIDPAIIPYLERGTTSFQVLGPNIVPIGAYLPRTGNTLFVLITPTLPPPPTATPQPTQTLIIVNLPTPTSPSSILPTRPLTRMPQTGVLYYPTSPPLPEGTETTEMIATVLAFAAQLTPVSLPYPGADCAPGGIPVEGLLAQRFHGYHPGIDIALPPGSPVYATHSGIITWADWNEFGYGNLVIIQSGRFITYYAHNTSFNVRAGDVIAKGSIVAFSGNTGNSSGPHVHYETRIDDVPVDPLSFDARGFPSC